MPDDLAINLKSNFAHIDNSDNTKAQSLYQHLVNTARNCEKTADKVKLGKTAYLIGLLHDIGKINPKFQEKIKENKKIAVDHSTLGGLMIAYIFKEMICHKDDTEWKEFYNDKVKSKSDVFSDYCSILIYSILSHHGQFDMVRKNSCKKYVFTCLDRFQIYFQNIKQVSSFCKESIEDVFENLLSQFAESGIYVKNLLKQGFDEYLAVISKLDTEAKRNSGEKQSQAMDFYRAMLTRLLCSILKSADIKDTINAYGEIIQSHTDEELVNIIDYFAKQVKKKYDSFPSPVSNIDKARHEIAEMVGQRSKIDKTGIYKLDLPTGAGKTLLSLLYGINQMKCQGKERFLYITSYLSVLEQNAEIMRKILAKDEYVLEHHSNVVSEETGKLEVLSSATNDEADSKEETCKRFLLEDWTSPVILSTMVQFFNTLLKGSSSNLTRFKSLIHSVIILDELQSLPTELLYLANLSLNFLKTVMGASIILSTATQPIFNYEDLTHRLSYGSDISGDVDIVKLSEKELKPFDRVEVHLYKNGEQVTLKDVAALIKQESDKSELIILNTKLAVKKLYELLETYYKKDDLYYLTTNLHAADRLRIINEIKNRLLRGEKICAVSTQLVEAGVELDFDFVVRSYSGIDSIVQAIGRCNREGKRDKGLVYLINLNEGEENLTNLRSIMLRKKAASYTIRKNEKTMNRNQGELNIIDLVNPYFEKLYANIKELDLSFPIKNRGSILDLLSSNIEERYLLSGNSPYYQVLLNKNKDFLNDEMPINMYQAFKTAYDNFHLINDQQNSAVVQCKETEGILNQIESLWEAGKRSNDFKNISCIKKLLKKLGRYSVPVYESGSKKCVSMLDGLLLVLPSEFYDSKIGLHFDDTQAFIL